MSDKFDQAVIIKKFKKQGQAAHGGSWKVAYADFITSMMAIFLLLWLLNMTSAQKKVALSQYFQNHSIFEMGGGSATGRTRDIPGPGLFDVSNIPAPVSPRTLMASDAANKFKEKVEKKTRDYSDRVMVYNDNGKLRIELTDTTGDSFFKPGGAEISESGKALLKDISTLLIGVDNRIIIEGHTDASKYAQRGQTNWELSTSRASSARVELEKNGIRPDQIDMVAGYADTRPLDRSNPYSSKNRRISIVIDYTTQKTKSPALPEHVKNEAPWIKESPAARTLP
ncbi:MAG TPA: OmpA family protein [Deltaproteobacteria bacterium]|nr:OmpA family protein [Deltaproteobacteria bacterium]